MIVVRLILCGAVGGVCVLSACTMPQLRADFTSLSPAERARAIALAGRSQDRSPPTTKELIEELDSADPAIRMLAIGTLRNLWDGQTFGYDYAAPLVERRVAIAEWVAWYERTQAMPEP